MKTIVWFNEITKDDVGIVGGKGANLGELTRAGFPVPPGFAVTAQAYKYFIESTGIKDDILDLISKVDINDTDALQLTAKKIQSIIKSEEIPYKMKSEIINAYNNLLTGNKFEGLKGKALELVSVGAPKEPFVAVRSSATAEDLPGASFAGQQETFLNVKGAENVITAVKACWASLFTARAIFYRETNHFPHDKVLISVIIQKMVDSEKSGVAFSIHPATGDKSEIVIEAGWGLGEFIVQGEINPDQYIVDKDSLTIKKKLVKRQTKMLTRDPLSGKNIEVELPEQKQERQVLDDEQIVTLAKVVKRIEAHYGKPQDIEWASENNRLFIVQARPVTFFGKKEVKEEVSGDVLVRGLPASPGVATGRVVIIKSADELDKIKKGDILVTTMTDPDMVPAMERAAAIVTDEGGLTSHAAIVSRELGVPAVVGCNNATKVLSDGMIVKVDADNGVVIKADSISSQEPQVSVNAPKPVSRDYSAPVTATKIYMNLGVPEKISEYASFPFDGIGLMRVEFIIASKINAHPLYLIKQGRSDEYVKALADGISTVAGTVKPRPVIVRFSDFKTNEYAGLTGGKEFEPEESNPMIGWRGCSRYVSKEFEQAFRLECRAVKRVRDAGLTNVWVMLPFVRNTSEVKRVLEIMSSEGLERSNDFKVFIMAEVPSVIWLAEEFAKLCDGFSIGSNDLTQLTLGVDRDSSKLGSMGYFDERNDAVKRSISHLIRVAHEQGVSVSICGQAPSEYPDFTEFLVNEGIDSISVNHDVVLQTRDLVSSVERKLLLRLARSKSNEGNNELTVTQPKIDVQSQQSNDVVSHDNNVRDDFVSDGFSVSDDEQNNDSSDEDKGMFWP